MKQYQQSDLENQNLFLKIYNRNKIEMLRALLISVVIFFTTTSLAQKINDVVQEKEPLILKSIGSFYVGGETETQTKSEMGGFYPGGHLTVNQMYVSFMVPLKRKDSSSFVFIHGMNLSGKTYETTPDGGMGWNEYFTRKGYAVYVADQVGHGRSGFNAKSYNKVRNKEIEPGQQPSIIRISDENTLMNFRFQEAGNKSITDSKFPALAYAEFSKQSIPFMGGTVPNHNPNFKNLAELAASLKQTVLVSHSQSGSFPVQAALVNAEGIKAIVLVEPGGTASGYTDEQIKALSKIPVLIVYGDNLENDTGVPGHSWKAYYDGWNKFLERLKAAGGIARMLYLPDLGIKGNSHMLMMDTNNQQIADLILNWLATTKK